MNYLNQLMQKLRRPFAKYSPAINNSPLNTSANRRKFIYIFSATVVTMAYNACSPGFKVNGKELNDALGSSLPPGTLPPPDSSTPTGREPVWETIPTITFTKGVPSRISIAAYVTDPDRDVLTITKNAAALPAGVTFDAATMSFVYDGVGDIASTGGHILTATEG